MPTEREATLARAILAAEDARVHEDADRLREALDDVMELAVLIDGRLPPHREPRRLDEAGRKGGLTTKARHGDAYYKRIGQRGRDAQRRGAGAS